MKLICLNVALFESNNPKVAEFIKQEQPDILCLQEVTRQVDAQAKQEYISKLIIDQASPTLSYSFYAPIWNAAGFDKKNFHGFKHFKFELNGRAELGNYIRSKFSIVKGSNIFVQNNFAYITDWSNWPEEDYRAVQVVDLKLSNSRLRVLNYHGIWSRDKLGTDLTLNACKKIKELALEVDYPAIICGDFNLFPDSPSMQLFYDQFESLVDSFKVKTTRPQSNELHDKNRNIVDYVLVSKDIKVKSFLVPDSDISDHLPLIVDFDM